MAEAKNRTGKKKMRMAGGGRLLEVDRERGEAGGGGGGDYQECRGVQWTNYNIIEYLSPIPPSLITIPVR